MALGVRFPKAKLDTLSTIYAAGGKVPTVKTIRRKTPMAESERQRLIDEVLEKLEREGYLERVPGKVDPVEGRAWRYTKKRPPGALTEDPWD